MHGGSADAANKEARLSSIMVTHRFEAYIELSLRMTPVGLSDL